MKDKEFNPEDFIHDLDPRHIRTWSQRPLLQIEECICNFRFLGFGKPNIQIRKFPLRLRGIEDPITSEFDYLTVLTNVFGRIRLIGSGENLNISARMYSSLYLQSWFRFPFFFDWGQVFISQRQIQSREQYEHNKDKDTEDQISDADFVLESPTTEQSEEIY